ncbi:MAG: PilZ domain-containing protein [Planctomycetota bacterium]
MQGGLTSSAGHKSSAGTRPGGRKCARAGRRIAHRIPCRVRLYDPESGQPSAMLGQTTNISNSGLAVQVARHVPNGTWVETLVPHVNGDPIFVCGVVVHSRRVLGDEFEIGIEYSGDSPPPVF